MEPAVGVDRRRGGGRVVAVAARTAAGCGPTARRRRPAPRCRGSAGRSVPARSALRLGEAGHGDQRAGLGDAEPGGDDAAEPRGGGSLELGVERRAAAAEQRRAERSKWSTTGWRAKAATSGGATSAWSTRWSCIARSVASRSKRASVTTVAPASSPRWSTHCRPMLWKNGASPSSRLALAAGNGICIWTRLATSARWVSSTSLGRPVVPLEGSSTATSRGSGRSAGGSPRPPASSSPSSSTSTPASRRRARAVSASGPTVTTSRGRARRSWSASSRAVYSGLAQVTMPPARSAACSASGNSGRFGRCSASTSPRAEAAAGEAAGDALHPGRERAVGERAAARRRRSARAGRRAARRGGGRTTVRSRVRDLRRRPRTLDDHRATS